MEFQVNEVSLRRGQRATTTKSTNQPAIELLQHQYGCSTCCFVSMHVTVRVHLYVSLCLCVCVCVFVLICQLRARTHTNICTHQSNIS